MSTFRLDSYARSASISASSYNGSGQVEPYGMHERDRARVAAFDVLDEPVQRLGVGGGAGERVAPVIGGTARAPAATSSTS